MAEGHKYLLYSPINLHLQLRLAGNSQSSAQTLPSNSVRIIEQVSTYNPHNVQSYDPYRPFLL